jgi:uncharacterized membrane protein (DUF4010 family)
MFKNLDPLLIEGLKILLVLFLSFIIGMEREEKKILKEHYYFGGVRTFPLIGLLGYGLALLGGSSLLLLSLGLIVLGGFFSISYWHKISIAKEAGLTSEVTGLITYALGALVSQEHYWIAATLVVISLLLLGLKQGLESLSERIGPEEILTFTKFLLLTGVILPVVPNREFTAFQLNPFKIWLVVVAVSTLSYFSYILQRLANKRESVVFSALFGGAYSSTATTAVLAKRARGQNRPHLFSGSILIASGMMYLRLIILLAFLNRSLLAPLLLPFLLLTAAACLAGWLLSRLSDPADPQSRTEKDTQNPLEIKAALLFGMIFVVVLVITRLTLTHLGVGGVYGLATLMGLADVDPFILSLTQTAGSSVPWNTAIISILIAASSNNMVKGIYALFFAGGKTGSYSLILLLLLALAGLAPLFFI